MTNDEKKAACDRMKGALHALRQALFHLSFSDEAVEHEDAKAVEKVIASLREKLAALGGA